MAIAKITTWINDAYRSYDHGRALYEQYGSNKLLLALFKGGNSPYHLRRLKAALEELNPSLQEEISRPMDRQIPQLDDFSGPERSAVKAKPDYNSLPEALKGVTAEKNQHYRRANQLFIEIGYTESEEKRLEMALVLLDDHDQVQNKWGVIDEYTRTGRILEKSKLSIEEEINMLSVLDLSKAAKNIPTYLSKDKHKVETMAEGRHKAKVLQRIAENEIKMDMIKKRLENV